MDKLGETVIYDSEDKRLTAMESQRQYQIIIEGVDGLNTIWAVLMSPGAAQAEFSAVVERVQVCQGACLRNRQTWKDLYPDVQPHKIHLRDVLFSKYIKTYTCGGPF